MGAVAGVALFSACVAGTAGIVYYSYRTASLIRDLIRDDWRNDSAYSHIPKAIDLWSFGLGNPHLLPRQGERPYVSPNRDGTPRRIKGGWEDKWGNRWEWPPAGARHGGPHWDVQHKNGKHTNVTPKGKVIGPDNFPNAPSGQ